MENYIDIIKLIYDYIALFFIIYLVGYSTFMFLSVIVGSTTLYQNRRQNVLRNELDNAQYIPISILVPAHNEEVTIVSTVQSLLALDYGLYEIIVIDDGSTDLTSEVLIEKFSMKKIKKPIRIQIECQPEVFVYETHMYKVPITLIKKVNGGKADALNMGINSSNYPYFICIDADSILQYDSLEKIVKPILMSDKVIAVGSAVRPSNGAILVDGHVVDFKLPKNMLACMQVLEYDRSFLAARIFFDKFNGSMIISGAFGLFKKDVVIAAGGYDDRTLGEDMELVVKLHVYCRKHNIDYQVRYATDAICWSQVPEKMNDLMQQRRRWQIGLLQSLMTHKTMFFNPGYGLLSFVSYLYFLIYELLSPYIEVFGVISIFLAGVVGILNTRFMILFLLVYALYAAILSLTAFFSRVQTINLKIGFRDACKAILLSVVEVSFLRFIISWVRMTAINRYRKVKRTWGRIERKKIDYN
jgi:biofilm PGA synthesis N-glycosyltransferase PgaC